MSSPGSRRERTGLAAALRAEKHSLSSIAAVLSDRFGVNSRVAWREANGWSQDEAARRWSDRWPDEPKTLKNFSYWENWPGPTGYAPSLAVLCRLSELYSCRPADLISDLGEHRTDSHAPDTGSLDLAPLTALAWQFGRLEVHELAGGLAEWIHRLPPEQGPVVLWKLSTAAAIALGDAARPSRAPGGLGEAGTLAGQWRSSYRYSSTSRVQELEGRHDVVFRADGHSLRGRSVPQGGGSVLDVELAVDGLVASGSWSERTSPTGHYRGAVYSGLIQFIIDPTGQTMSGRWLGVGKRFTVKSGEWYLERIPPGEERGCL